MADLFKSKKQHVENTEQETLNRAKSAFRDLVPFEKIRNGCLIDKNGKCYPVIQMGTKNLDLMSKADKAAMAQKLEEVYGSMKTKKYQFSLIPVPYDISVWTDEVNRVIESIETTKQEVETKLMYETDEWKIKKLRQQRIMTDARLQLMREEKNWVIDKVRTGELTTKRCYMTLDFEGELSLKDTTTKAKEVCRRFEQQDIDCKLITDRELRNLLNTLCNPIDNSAKDATTTRMTPLYRG